MVGLLWQPVAVAQLVGRIEATSQGVGVGTVFVTSEEGNVGFSVVKFENDFSGVGVGLESPLFYTIHNTTDNRLIIAPRVSFEHHKNFLPMSLGGRASILYYTNFGEGILTLRPELGLTLRSNIYLFYGYHFTFDKSHLIPRVHQLTLGFTLVGGH